MNITTIKAVDIQDAWFQALVHILESGREYTIDCGSFQGQTRLELDYVTIQITHPGTHPLLPVIPLHYGIPAPVDANYLIQYMPYLMTSVVADNEEYTYGQYLEPQIAKVIKMFRDKGHGTNQAYMAIGDMCSIDASDPPCLRGIDCRVQDGQLHFMLTFRSWCAWAGLPANLAAIQLMKEYMAGEIGVKDGQIIAASKGLHLYPYGVKLAKIRTGKE